MASWLSFACGHEHKCCVLLSHVWHLGLIYDLILLKWKCRKLILNMIHANLSRVKLGRGGNCHLHWSDLSYTSRLMLPSTRWIHSGPFSLGEFIPLLLRPHSASTFRIWRSASFSGTGDRLHLEKLFGYLLEHKGLLCYYKAE